MSVTASAINEQARRLLRLPFAPRTTADTEAYLREFRKIIQARCENDAHALAVVERLVSESHHCPEPAAIIEACTEVEPPDRAADRMPAGCDICQGNGFQSYEKLDRYGQMVDVSDYCVCGRGQWLKAKHTEYREREATKRR